ncbi:MAG: PIG-L family deacetylase [Spirochaetales bacterium]|nr:PIG-L family deacetylase [Spirochaetales bacterium]MCF7937755.1 PIG-L family deacetylase [Spirochaetales bacterium]
MNSNFEQQSTKKNALILAPHTDDGEFGCGGTIVRLLSSGWKVWYAAFSIARESVPKGFPEDVLSLEVQKATATLGIAKEHLSVYDYPVRRFSYHRQEILEEMIKLRSIVDPDLVFLPSEDDVHQDHHVIHEEGIRAFKNRKILAYELPWNSISFRADYMVMLSRKEFETKLDAIRCYRSQEGRKYSDPDYLKSWAGFRGYQAARGYAEAFTVIRWVVHEEELL